MFETQPKNKKFEFQALRVNLDESVLIIMHIIVSTMVQENMPTAHPSRF